MRARPASQYKDAVEASHASAAKVWLTAFVLVAALSAAPVAADTPRSVLVMAKALDDLITLDPAEAFEFTGIEILANIYDRPFDPNPEMPAEPKGNLVESWQRRVLEREHGEGRHEGVGQRGIGVGGPVVGDSLRPLTNQTK